MSALGEYVHLYYKDYKKYGVARKDSNEAKIPNYSIDIINSRIRKEIPKVSDAALDTLKTRLKANTFNKINEEKNEWQIHQQKLINEIYSLL